MITNVYALTQTIHGSYSAYNPDGSTVTENAVLLDDNNRYDPYPPSTFINCYWSGLVNYRITTSYPGVPPVRTTEDIPY